VLFGKKLPPTSKVYFQFKLPGQTTSIRLSGQLVWQDWNGRGGVQFLDVPKTSRRLLEEFLGASLPKQKTPEFSDVTVEVEALFQPASLAVAEQTHGKVYIASLAEETSTAMAIVSSADLEGNNRRAQARYSCRVGAE